MQAEGLMLVLVRGASAVAMGQTGWLWSITGEATVTVASLWGRGSAMVLVLDRERCGGQKGVDSSGKL